MVTALPDVRDATSRARPQRVVAGILGGLALLAAVLWPLGPYAVWDAALAMPVRDLAGVVALTVVLVIVRVRRAAVLLPDAPPWGPLWHAVNASFLVAVATPGRLGALLRPAWLVPHGVPAGASLVGMVAERLLDLCVILVLLVVAGMWALPTVPGDLAVGLAGAQALLAMAAAGGLVGLAWLTWRGRRVVGGLRVALAGRSWAEPWLGGLDAVVDAAAALRAHPARAAEAAAWTLVMWALGLGMGAGIIASLDTPDLGLRVTIAYWAAVMVANVAAPTPGGVGAYEAVGTAVLVGFGADPAAAAGVTLAGHATTLGVQCAFGLVSLPFLVSDTAPPHP